MIDPKIIVRIGLAGVESIDIQADNEQEQAAAEEVLNHIRPCFDVADAILKKTSAGLRG